MLVTGKGKAKSTQELISASIEALIGALESGHSEVLTSYLNAMARFHYYSFGNILLITTQKRDASHAAGMYAWNQLARRVKRGEKGIMILSIFSLQGCVRPCRLTAGRSCTRRPQSHL